MRGPFENKQTDESACRLKPQIRGSQKFIGSAGFSFRSGLTPFFQWRCFGMVFLIRELVAHIAASVGVAAQKACPIIFLKSRCRLPITMMMLTSLRCWSQLVERRPTLSGVLRNYGPDSPVDRG